MKQLQTVPPINTATTMNSCSRLVALFLLILSAVLTDAASNIKQRVNISRQTDSSVLEYMLQLKKAYTDSNGRPRVSDTGDPTEIWALQDIDTIHHKYRSKPAAGRRCKAMNRFYFSWKAAMEMHEDTPSVLIEKSILRTYLNAIPRLISSRGYSVVTVEVYMKPMGGNDSSKVLSGTHNLTVTTESSSWVEINVTQGIRKLWLQPNKEDTIEVTLMLSTDCHYSRKVPATFVDPTSVDPVLQARRRKKLSGLQPLLVVYFSNERIKEIVRNESLTSDEEELETADIQDDTQANARRRRSSNGCHMENFVVDFEKLNIDYIITPIAYNARQCTGSCSHEFLHVNGHIGNNYAKIMAGAKEVYKDSRDVFPVEPKGPCCIPTEYSSLNVIEREADGILYQIYPNMKVEACGCR